MKRISTITNLNSDLILMSELSNIYNDLFISLPLIKKE
jgi:hypothetical protein